MNRIDKNITLTALKWKTSLVLLLALALCCCPPLLAHTTTSAFDSDSLQIEKPLLQEITSSYLKKKVKANISLCLKDYDESKTATQLEKCFELIENYKSTTTSGLVKNAFQNALNDIAADRKLASIEQVQSMLANNEALLEYLMYDTVIHVMVITPKKTSLHHLPNDFEVKSTVKDLLATIATPILGADYTERKSVFAKMAFQAYQKLIEPLGTLPEKLIVVPDGELNYLPFEILIKNPASESTNFSEFDYLLKTHTISYSYSASFLYEVDQQQLGKGGFLGMAPAFNTPNEKSAPHDLREELYALNCNKMEVADIQKIYGGVSFFDQSATVNNFLRAADGANIVHLATHACVDEKNPMLNKLYFTDDFLTSADVMDAKINANLAVLSACQTGAGSLSSGEGTMSLARSFAYSGAKSVVSSLWSVDDCSTSELMTQFYLYLEKGYSKDEALRMAKLRYLAKSSQYESQPFFWASFIPTGDMRPLKSKYSALPFHRIFFLLLAMMLFFSFLEIKNLRFFQQKS